MKAAWTTFVAVVLAALPVCAQTSPAANISTRPLTREQFAIYRDFLSTYGKYEEQLSNLLGMQPLTVPFVIDSTASLGRGPLSPEGCLHHVVMEPQSDAVHRLPPEIMRFSSFDLVSHQIAAAGKTSPRYVSPEKTKGVGPDGWVLTQFTLSEVAFDVTHRYAVFNFAANCNCLGGQGGTVLYEFKRAKWVRSKVYCAHSEG